MKGFSLLELMAAIAVIGVLAAISVPIYQSYIVRSQILSALVEVSMGKAGFESVISSGGVPSLEPDAHGYLGLEKNTAYCHLKLLPALAPDSIQCETRGGLSVFNDRAIILQRSTVGEWRCFLVGFSSDYQIGSCSSR